MPTPVSPKFTGDVERDFWVAVYLRVVEQGKNAEAAEAVADAALASLRVRRT